MTDQPDGHATERLNWVERHSKTITTIATASIPIILAAFTYLANNAINERNLSKEYVNLAIGILKEDIDEVGCQSGGENVSVEDCAALTDEQALRQFAVDLINTNSDHQLEGKAADAVIYGKVTVTPVIEGQTEGVVASEESSDATQAALAELELFNSLEDRQEEFAPDCTLSVRAEVSDVGGERVQPGGYTATAQRTQSAIVFVQIEGGTWIRINDSTDLGPQCAPG